MPVGTAEAMYAGRLRARGTLSLAQFWPTGSSDSDTATMTIKLNIGRPFVFRPQNGVEAETRAFHDGHIRVKGQPKPVLGAKRDRLKIRLQGIDAPELHYAPTVRGARKIEFRQRLAESSVVALRDMLGTLSAGSTELRADAISFVSAPGDAFDMYARYVGNITVYADGFAVDINHWLLEHGWAVPGLYNSMTERELLVARSLSQAAADKRLGLYKSGYYRDKLVAFERDLRYRSPKSVSSASVRLYADGGPLMNPKFFRRQAEFEVKRQIGSTAGAGFKQFLEGEKARDKAILWNVYSKLSARERRSEAALRAKSVKLGSLVTGSGSLPPAQDLINIESDSSLVTAAGQPINSW